MSIAVSIRAEFLLAEAYFCCTAGNKQQKPLYVGRNRILLAETKEPHTFWLRNEELNL